MKRFKYRLLTWLTNDIHRKIIKKRGYVFLQDMRTIFYIEQLAKEAYELQTRNKEDK